MAIQNRSSTAITNRDASPLVLSNPSFSKQEITEAYDYVAPQNADSIGSVYRLCNTKSNFRVADILLQCSALGAGAAVDIGAYYGNDAKDIFKGQSLNGAVIQADFFGSAVDVSAALGKTNVTNESGNNTIAKQQMPLWQALGLASDPECSIDICATVTGAIAANGFLAATLRYCE